tara:strand:+ start:154 stop:828 length:675 start_codon:yes stop_codon:yes gene_type:complete
MKYSVNDIFETIQGEATFTGTPSIFIRLQGCLVGCGFCDTKFTWEKNINNSYLNVTDLMTKPEENEIYGIIEDTAIIEALQEKMANHIVITGGEPCEQDLTALTQKLLNKGYSVQIETSGTQEIKAHEDTWVTLSPKIGKSIKSGKPIRADSLERCNELKYPIGKQQDIMNLKELINNHSSLTKKPIWLAPLSQKEKATRLCIEEAIINNWKISIQTHKYISVK